MLGGPILHACFLSMIVVEGWIENTLFVVWFYFFCACLFIYLVILFSDFGLLQPMNFVGGQLYNHLPITYLFSALDRYFACSDLFNWTGFLWCRPSRNILDVSVFWLATLFWLYFHNSLPVQLGSYVIDKSNTDYLIIRMSVYIYLRFIAALELSYALIAGFRL